MPDEAETLKKRLRPGLLRRLLGKPPDFQPSSIRVTDVITATVQRCFILADFNEEMPLYFLDLGTGTILIFFGQWLFDPHTLVVPDGLFEKWEPGREFFASFCMRCSIEHGFVFKLTSQGVSFAPAERLPRAVRFRWMRECVFFSGQGDTLISDLEMAGIVYT